MKKFCKVIILDNLAEYEGIIVTSFEAAKSFFENIKNKKFNLVLRFQTDEDLNETLNYIFKNGNICLVAEEVDFISNAYGNNKYFEKILKYGRHKKIDLIAISRRPAEVSRLLTSQSDEIISFRQNEERDLDFLEKRGFDREKLRSLKDFESLVIN